MKVIIAGGRDFMDYGLLKTKCDGFFRNSKGVEIVCGKAKGADSLGELYANENGLPLHEFPANWNMHGKAAGPIRNEEMGNFGDALVAFWDGKSRGTKHMIDYMKGLGKPVRVVHY